MQTNDDNSLDLPVAEKIRSKLLDCSPEKRIQVLGEKSESEFIRLRVKMFLTTLNRYFREAKHIDPKDAELSAYQKCISDL